MIFIVQVTALTSRSDLLPALQAIFTNPSIIKIGHSIRQTLQIVADIFSLSGLRQMLKTKTAPLLDLGKLSKLKGKLEDPAATLHALAGIALGRSFSVPQFSPYPWSGTSHSQQNSFLVQEVDCLWQIYVALIHLDSLGLPLLPIQAATHGQRVTLLQGCKRIAEGSIIGNHDGYLEAVMDDEGHTKRINISPSRSLIEISKVSNSLRS